MLRSVSFLKPRSTLLFALTFLSSTWTTLLWDRNQRSQISSHVPSHLRTVWSSAERHWGQRGPTPCVYPRNLQNTTQNHKFMPISFWTTLKPPVAADEPQRQANKRWYRRRKKLLFAILCLLLTLVGAGPSDNPVCDQALNWKWQSKRLAAITFAEITLFKLKTTKQTVQIRQTKAD